MTKGGEGEGGIKLRSGYCIVSSLQNTFARRESPIYSKRRRRPFAFFRCCKDPQGCDAHSYGMLQTGDSVTPTDGCVWGRRREALVLGFDYVPVIADFAVVCFWHRFLLAEPKTPAFRRENVYTLGKNACRLLGLRYVQVVVRHDKWSTSLHKLVKVDGVPVLADHTFSSFFLFFPWGSFNTVLRQLALLEHRVPLVLGIDVSCFAPQL